MWVIIERSKENPRNCWIAGVFNESQDAQKYLSACTDYNIKFNTTSELREIPAKDYPVLFVTDFENPDFIYVTAEKLAEKLLAYKKIEDEDHVYCIFYIFREDYRSIVLGEDYLGWSDHHHVDNDTMKRLIWQALSIQSVGCYDGIYRCCNCEKLSAGILSAHGYGPPPNWQIIPWADSKTIELESYLRNEGERVPETHSATYLTVCSEECCTSLKDLK